MSKERVDPKLIAELPQRYKITSGADFDLDRFATDDLPSGVPAKQDAKDLLRQGVQRLAALQELLYADARWSVLLVFQAMDAGGKDSTIEHVLSGINPQGVSVTSFKAPSSQELAHDFLWRVHRAIPARGMIGVFNRSHYEEVLVTRVHENLLDGAHLPARLRAGTRVWQDRIADIAAFETYLARQGVLILKFFLNVGRDEQKKRLLARLDDPRKTWKFEPADLRERALWPAYRAAYTEAIAGTAGDAAPWFVIPADRKWYTRLVVAQAVITALEGLELASPEVPEARKGELAELRQALSEDLT